MGSVGACFDNAMCESFNATLECKLLVKHRFRNPREAALAVFDFIEGWYNPIRRHTYNRLDLADGVRAANESGGVMSNQ
jgi:putative transposase